jgi:RNA polymerase sigma-70 factor (sigma-E family)
MADDDAFREFVTARWSALVRTAYLLTGDHGRAEDLVQSALERVHRQWRRVERKHAPEAYTRRVMINLAISGSRRHRFRETSLANAPEPVSRDAAYGIAERDEVWQALLKLPPRMRAVLVLRHFEDLSEAEVARLLGCGLGTVKSQSSRGLDRLRELLGPGAQTDDAAPSTITSSNPTSSINRITSTLGGRAR